MIQRPRLTLGLDQILGGRSNEAKQELFDRQVAQFEKRAIQYDDLKQENAILKTDLRNLAVTVRKMSLDDRARAKSQQEIREQVDALGMRYLSDVEKWIGRTLTTNNYAKCKKQLTETIASCRDLGLSIPNEREERLLSDLNEDFKKKVRIEEDRAEQARIKAQIREEQKIEREIARAIEQAERERAAIAAALERALADKADEHAEEIAQLRQKLVEAELRAERTKSQAELTKAGHVYVISNIGSFGDGVFKVGMTRRLEPNDRVKELGDASVPFAFDIHMMISSDNAPALENALHKALHRSRLNRCNPRKEFFRADIDQIRLIVEEHHGVVDYVVDAEALEYRQSVEMTDDVAEFIESVYEEVRDDDESITED